MAGTADSARRRPRVLFERAADRRQNVAADRNGTTDPSSSSTADRLIDIEYTALKMLIEGEERLRTEGITLWLASLNPQVLKTVQQSPLGETLGRARMFFNLHSAVAHYEQLQSKQIAVNH